MNVKKGNSLWKKAKSLIPGGSQLLSKRSEMFLPDLWPSFYKKAKGVEIWDLDGNKYIDMTIMGVGACILGYADETVNDAVRKVINNGSMATLNCPEEVELAELLCNIHPWAESVRYTRTGGEAMAVAVRIARAFTTKDKIAFCGYHGWHDWYLASNLADNENLDGHLLPGLDPLGVPRVLKNTAIPFEYNDIDKLESIVNKNKIGVIIVEPIRHQEPKNDFLKKIRKIADDNDIVLIFDEITSGWRLTVGGAHLLYGVNPDLMVSAKAISNGFPMGTVLGRYEIMDIAQESFISSTYWTERIGPTAALATIDKLKKNDVPKHIKEVGKMIAEGWKNLADKYNLNIEILKPYALITFNFISEISQQLKTLFTQEMLKRGFLASSSVYVSFSHQKDHVKEYLENVDEVFSMISEAIKKNEVKEKLEGPIAHTGFQRLT